MMKKGLFIFIFFLILLIAGLNQLAIDLLLYWKIWWFDIMMHFLGGLWIGLASLWIYLFSGYFDSFKSFKNKDWETILIISILSVFVVGVGWEIFEFIFEIDFSNNYIWDTTSDLIMDFVGSFVAASVIMFISNNFNKK